MYHALLLFSCPGMSNSLWPHGLQHVRYPCPSGVCPSSRLLHQWCHPAISSSDALFSSCPQSFPAWGTVPVSQLSASDDQGTGVSASVFPTCIQGWCPLSLTSLISLQSMGLLGVFSSTTVRRHQFFGAPPSLRFSSHNKGLHRPLLAEKCLCFSTHCRSSPAKKQTSSDFVGAVTTCSDFRAPQKRKSDAVSTFSPSICHDLMGPWS